MNAIQKIISGKIVYYDLDKAKTTKSVYVTFEPNDGNDTLINVRISDHTTRGETNDTLEPIEEFEYEVLCNIFNGDSKKQVLSYLKNKFGKIPISSDKNVISFKLEKKVKLAVPAEIAVFLNRQKIKISSSDAETREAILKKLLSRKPKGWVIKRDYELKRGMWKFVGERKIEGVFTSIASTGGQASIGSVTAKDFYLSNKIDRQLLNLLKKGFKDKKVLDLE